MKSLNDVYNRFPFRSIGRFVPKAIKFGFTRKQATDFLDSLPHDKKFTKQPEMMLPIYSRHHNSYQMDTLVQTKNALSHYYLILININSRKIYAYQMDKKDSSSVLSALQKFIKEVKHVHSITSDQDAAYTSAIVTKFMIDHKIDHQTTFKNDHNRLGIINRAIKTLRDINQSRDFTTESMERALYAYNNSTHKATNKEPNEFTEADEDHYIAQKIYETDERANKYTLPEKTHVRVMNPPDPHEKKRWNLTPEAYKVAYKTGNKYVIQAKDNSVSEYPRYRLIPDNKAKLAKTLGTNRAIINKIISYDNEKYKVRYDDRKTDMLPVRNLREGRPTRLSPLELEFWKKHKKQIPNGIKALMV